MIDKSNRLILSSIHLPFVPHCSVQFHGVACVLGRFYYYSIYVRYVYLNLALNSFSLRKLRMRYQLRSFESVAKTDNYELLSGYQWKKRWRLAVTATEFPV